MNNLEGRVGFPGSCGHNQKDAFLAPRHSLYSSVDGYALVITRLEAVGIGIIWHVNDVLFFHCEPLVFLKPCTQRKWCREIIVLYGTFLSCQHVVFYKCLTIRRVSKRDVEYLGIIDSLLYAVTGRMIIVFCLYNCYGVVLLCEQDIVGSFPLLSVF